ncbi:aromatic amino acid aminotransferase [Archaeoglobales archaeon ex4484_92]|nr:MAG: aromatic amino acid aminotransferase [Archaeoglobales archaeon ex4484_92]
MGGSPLYRRVAKKVAELQPSGIRRFFDLVSGREDIISLGVGEPDFAIPWRIREEMIYSLEKGFTSYTSNLGLQELREEISRYYKKFGLKSNPNQILITSGVSEAIDLSIRTIIEPGDSVLIPEPCYVSYKPLTLICGGEAITIPTTPDFKLTYEKLINYSETNSKALILNYPSNPTGMSYTKKELEEIADAIIEMDLLVISDEIYSELTYSGRHVSIASLNGMEDRTIVLNGFSKSFAMTGLRIGYAIAPEDILDGMTKIHQYCMLCAPITSQIGALEALKSMDEVDRMRAEYMRRRNYLVKKFSEVFSIRKPDGTFYAFPDISSTGLSSMEFTEKLLIDEKVAVVPGNAFGECGEGYIRIAFAIKFDLLREAVERIIDFAKRYGKS